MQKLLDIVFVYVGLVYLAAGLYLAWGQVSKDA